MRGRSVRAGFGPAPSRQGVRAGRAYLMGEGRVRGSRRHQVMGTGQVGGPNELGRMAGGRTHLDTGGSGVRICAPEDGIAIFGDSCNAEFGHAAWRWNTPVHEKNPPSPT